MMETVVTEGGPLGLQVAEYVFRLSGGREIRAPIRERFQISAVMGPAVVPGNPGAPYLAVSDQKAMLLPRYTGGVR